MTKRITVSLNILIQLSHHGEDGRKAEKLDPVPCFQAGKVREEAAHPIFAGHQRPIMTDHLFSFSSHLPKSAQITTKGGQ